MIALLLFLILAVLILSGLVHVVAESAAFLAALLLLAVVFLFRFLRRRM